MCSQDIIFYREWLPLDKADFRIMAMLADKEIFQGNLADLCRYFSLSEQSRNRNALRSSIQRLKELTLLDYSNTGNSYVITPIPKEKRITMPRAWFEAIRISSYSESVAWESLLKVYLWLADNNLHVITREMIAVDVNLSASTISACTKVLSFDFGAITKEKVSEKIGEDFFRTIGQSITPTAWWHSN